MIESYMRTIREAAPRLREVNTELAKAVAQLQKDPDFKPEARDRRIQAAKAEANKMVREIRAEVTEARSQVEKYSKRALAEEGTGLEAGLDHDRSWSRLLRRLEAGTAPGQLVEELSKAGDGAGIRALRRELPDYLKSKATAPGVDGGVGPDATDAAVERISTQLDRALLPHLPAKQRTALQARLELPHRVDGIEREVLMSVSPNATTRMAAGYAANAAQRELEALEPSNG